MKTLFIVDNLGAGGAERSLQELLVPLAAAGVEPTVACFQRRAEGVEHLLPKASVRILKGPSRLAQMSELRALARRERFDLIHTTLFEADVFGRPSFLGLDIPIVTSLVNMPYEPARLESDPNVNPRKLAAVRWLEIVTGRLCASHFHAITGAVKQAATERLMIPSARITVVQRGRDPERLGRRSVDRRQLIREHLGIAPDAFVVLNAARQEFQKGQRYLLEAFPRVLAERPDALLLIAGRSGNATRELEAAARPLGDRVRFLAHREDIPDLMAAADVFALPSLWEGLGCVLIEAMALELPIVASDIAPVREVAGNDNAALLVPVKQSEPLASALLSIAHAPDTGRRLAEAGRSLFERNFTLERSAHGMYELFRMVVERHALRQAG
jgi:glycosyltransferase involved in cell wall biosynthesis